MNQPKHPNLNTSQTNANTTPPSALVSACLLGRPCRYDGATKSNAAVASWRQDWLQRGGEIVAICPEELGDLGTPRPAAQLCGGDGAAVWRGEAQVRRVEDGGDVTAAFLSGAQQAFAQAPQATVAILKARSPSCGVGRTRIDGGLHNGDGVFAALLRSRGVNISTEQDLQDSDA